MNSIVIPPMPEGVAVRSNLYGNVYGDLPPLSWDNPDFHSRLGWMKDQVPFEIVSWKSDLNISPGVEPLRTSTTFRAEVKPGVGFDFDVRNVMQDVRLLVYALRGLLGLPFQEIAPYPGLEALHPSGERPVGAPWIGHPWGRGRRLFYDIGGEAFAVNDTFGDDEFLYQKVRLVVQSAAGPTSQGGKVAFAWQVVYDKR